MNYTKVENISKKKKKTFDIGVKNNQNLVANGHVIHNSGYRGEIKVLIRNHSEQDYLIEKGDKIAQLVPIPVTDFEINEVNDFEDTERGTGGFGSSD